MTVGIPRPYVPRASDGDIEDLQRRLRQTRWPDQVADSGWSLGTDGDYLRGLCAYWADEFDWRLAEARISQWPHFLVDVDGQQIHFIHARAAPDTAPVVLLQHGWPGSVFEFVDVIPRLTEAGFHVVCPSLPGFGWGGPTLETGWSPRRIAGAYQQLMTALGYDRFFTHGGDYGAATGMQLAVQAPERVIGTHITIVPTAGHRAEDGEPTEQEREFAAETAAYAKVETGYIELQRTKPQTVAYALNDSPAGLAAWIVEKFWRWTDHQGNLEDAVPRDLLLANITLYWLTGTIGSAARIYHASASPGEAIPITFVDVPVGCAIFPAEIYPASRRWAEHHYRVVRWTQMPRGGHFAALEAPELVAEDFIAFARQVQAD